MRWASSSGGVSAGEGGMRALEWAATAPDRVARLFLLASPAAASADRSAGARRSALILGVTTAETGGDGFEHEPEVSRALIALCGIFG